MSANASVSPGADTPDVGLSVDASGQMTIDLFRPPSEDAGAKTSANYHYQTEIIASFCACMPTDASITKIICEWHEDFIIYRENEAKPIELVSVKHRDRDDYTTFGQLCDAGGLAHLLDRWLSFSNAPRARLCSNAKLSGRPSEPTPRALEEICNQRNFSTPEATAVIAHLAWAMLDIVKNRKDDSDAFENIPKPVSIPLPKKAGRGTSEGLPEGMFGALTRFLLHLRFDCNRPDKSHIGDTNIRQLVEPAMTHLGLASALASPAYERILQLVSKACRDQSGRPRDMARYLADPDAEIVDVAIVETVERRTITRDNLMSALSSDPAGAVADVPLLSVKAMPARAAGGHQLIDKMKVAGLGSDEQENALELRDLWLSSWPQIRTGFPEDVEHEFRLRLEILEIVRDVRHQNGTVPDPFGPHFQIELHKAIRAAKLGVRAGVALNDFHIIGLAYELSDLCRISFTRSGGAAA